MSIDPVAPKSDTEKEPSHSMIKMYLQMGDNADQRRLTTESESTSTLSGN
jgi:hypothetical protein